MRYSSYARRVSGPLSRTKPSAFYSPGLALGVEPGELQRFSDFRRSRMNRWSKSGVLDRLFEESQHAQIVRIRIEAVSLDSTVVKVHHDGTGALKIRPIRHWQSRGGWTTKIHMVAANARTAITFALW